jgi:hypothetical protein
VWELISERDQVCMMYGAAHGCAGSFGAGI